MIDYTEVKIDDSTGLPVLPNKLFWRVKEERYFDANYWFIEIRKKKNWVGSTSIVSQFVYVPGVYFKVVSADVLRSEAISVVRKYSIQEFSCAKSVRKHIRQFDREVKERKRKELKENAAHSREMSKELEEAAMAIRGDYPPKSLK